MEESRKVIRIFLASPGDLQEERGAAKQAVDEINEDLGAFLGYHVELVGWELTVAALGRPQALINEELNSCEYFIGIIWKRWGTPPAKAGPFQSGFEEEFEESLKRYHSTGSPEISLFFKALSDEDKQDPGPQLQKVIEFKKRIEGDRELYFEEFSGLTEFERRIRRCVSRYLQRLANKEALDPAAEAQPPISTTDDIRHPSPARLEETPNTILLQSSIDFLYKFIEKAGSAASSTIPSMSEIARFRLLGTLLTDDGEDPTLGVHDANRLFASRNDFDMSPQECLGLLEAGLAEYHQENAPVWHWLMQMQPDELFWRSLVGRTEAVKVGALAAMRDLGANLPADVSEDRAIYLSFWFGENASVNRRTSALRYLGDFGKNEDLSLVQVELDKNDYQTLSVATDAFIKIALRESRARAFSALLALQPEKVDRETLEDLFRNTWGIEDQDLESGLGHRSSEVRVECIRALVGRGSFSEPLAETLLSDGSVDVRLEAVKYLAISGKEFSDAELDKLLVVRDGGGGLFSFGIARPIRNDVLEKYKEWKLSLTSDHDLEDRSSIFDREPEFALDERKFSRLGDKLREAVADGFHKKFEEALQDEIPNRSGDSARFVEEVRKLEQFICQKHTQQGLNVICRRGDGGDLALVRRLLDSEVVGYSEELMNFLKRHGEWEDVPRIVSSLERHNLGNTKTVLGLSRLFDDQRYVSAAKTLCFLGRDRVDELLFIEMPDRLRRQIVIEMPEVSFAGLKNPTLANCFRSKDSSVRKVAALKAVQALPRARQKELLASYLAEEYRFYNVIFWLDLGESLPRKIARSASKRVLARE